MNEEVLDWFLSLPAEKREQVADSLISKKVPVSKVKHISKLSMKNKEEALIEMGFLPEQVRSGSQRPIYAKDKRVSPPMRRFQAKGKTLDTPLSSEEAKLLIDVAKDFYVDRKGNKLRPTPKYVRVEPDAAMPRFITNPRDAKFELNPSYKEDNSNYIK